MLKSLKRLLKILPPTARTRAILYLPLSLLLSLCELGGLSLLLPLMAILGTSAVPDQAPGLQRLHQFLGQPDPQQFLWQILGLLLCLLMVREVVYWLSSWLRARILQQVECEMSARLLDAYLRKPYRFFLENHSSDFKQNTLLRVSTLVRTVLEPMSHLVSAMAISLSFGLMLVWTNPGVALGVGLLLGGPAHS